jgi:uncharacterized protein (DUF4415 family)
VVSASAAKTKIKQEAQQRSSYQRKRLSRNTIMKAHYDLTKMKNRRNPYAARLKKQLTLRMGLDIIEHFKRMAAETGIPYQNLINLYLRDCVQSQRKLQLKWAS